ncbi:MAG: bifunctional DNA-formamidopyrimidine glycosylase/DNA-(apurinic or apyrimidinic site) lyase [Calditrichia bacterium]
MPELPEVETIARQIRRYFLNRTIKHIEAKPVKIFQNVTALEFQQALSGKPVQSVNRIGKYLWWQVGDVFPVFHLGMSGIFIRDKKQSRQPKHIHISFIFQDGEKLYFQDVRKFSKIYLYGEAPQFPDLGVDPANGEFSLSKLQELLRPQKMNIKSFLMNQNIIAGIGNIYASEILFNAGISPFRSSRSIKGDEIEKLFQSIQKILEDAIRNYGTTYSAYQTVEGQSGRNQEFLKVYQRADKPCYNCGGTVEKIVQNSRSTFFCKKCQS